MVLCFINVSYLIEGSSCSIKCRAWDCWLACQRSFGTMVQFKVSYVNDIAWEQAGLLELWLFNLLRKFLCSETNGFQHAPCSAVIFLFTVCKWFHIVSAMSSFLLLWDLLCYLEFHPHKFAVLSHSPLTLWQSAAASVAGEHFWRAVIPPDTTGKLLFHRSMKKNVKKTNTFFSVFIRTTVAFFQLWLSAATKQANIGYILAFMGLPANWKKHKSVTKLLLKTNSQIKT